MNGIGTTEHPLRVAIVGSGPSGFYAAGHLLKSKSHPDLVAQVDMYDRLPTPWGLVRGGVAPDHPNIKAVSRVYEKTAQHPEFRFHGNVELGRDISRAELTDRYHAVIYAVGAQTDRRMGIPGEDLPGSWAATEFVAWYNGHPDYRDLEFDLSCERAVVIGNGNVAADVARMLALTRDELAATDVADHALEALARQRREGDRGARPARTRPGRLHEPRAARAGRDDRRRRVRGGPRRGARPAQPGVRGERGGEHHRAQERGDPHRATPAARPAGKPRRIVLRFLVSPVEILGDDRVTGVRICRNELAADESGAVRACATDDLETIDCGLVFRSIGYRGTPLEDLPFDERRGVIPNEGGRIVVRRRRRCPAST